MPMQLLLEVLLFLLVEQFSSDKDKMITKVGNLANQISNAIN